MKIQLENRETTESNPEHLATCLLARFGLLPRKKDGQAQMHKLLLELYERKKKANRERKPEEAVMPVEDMGAYAHISRQTMYEYLHRWIDLDILKKTTFVSKGKVITGYELNGVNVEGAFRKAEARVKNHLESSFTLIEHLQNEIKREKITASMREERPNPPGSSSPAPPETTPPASETPHFPHNASPEESPSRSST